LTLFWEEESKELFLTEGHDDCSTVEGREVCRERLGAEGSVVAWL